MSKWVKTKFPGVRYRDHETRKHGIKKDRYYTIRYKLKGMDKEEGLGWASEGWTESKAYGHLLELKENKKVGEGPQTLKEKRDLVEEKRDQTIADQERLKKDAVILDAFFSDDYLPQAENNKKLKTVTREKILYKNWVRGSIGHLPLKTIAPFHLEKLKKSMVDGGQSPRSIQYALALIRQIFNTAKRFNIYEGDSPTSRVKAPKVDNGRMRFLTRDEADKLLDLLKTKSTDVYEMTLLSLHAGLRFGEIASLTWQDVDIDKKVLTIRDAKAGSRYAFLTEQSTYMLKNRTHGVPSDYVFQGRNGKLDRMSPTFARAVDELKLNDGIEDPRLQICFHSCRHSYASWMIEQGADLYTVQKLLGHKTNVMTQRYAHLSENRLRDAAAALGAAWQKDLKPEQAISLVK
jgi:integrase